MPLELTVLSGPREGVVVRAGRDPVGIGRAPSNELHVIDATMSRLHATVTRRADGWWVEDLQSRNGVWVDDRRVWQHRLRDGDVVRFGKITEIRFSLPDGEVAAAALDPGRLVGDDLAGYRVLELLPTCGPGHRLRARDEARDRDVALRVFGPAATLRDGFAEGFEREVRIASRLLHPNVVGVLDRGEHGALTFVVEECAPGAALSSLLSERRFLRPQDAAKVALHVISGLAHIVGEAVAVPHLTPGAVLVSRAFDAKVVRLADPLEPAGRLPETDAGLVAPELALGRAVADETALVYCVGAVLYRMLCGIPPHDGSTVVQAAERAERALPANVRRVNLKVSPALERVVHDALDRDPGGRLPSLAEFAEALYRAV